VLLAADFPPESTSMAKKVHTAVLSPDLKVISAYEATYMVILVYSRPSLYSLHQDLVRNFNLVKC